MQIAAPNALDEVKILKNLFQSLGGGANQTASGTAGTPGSTAVDRGSITWGGWQLMQGFLPGVAYFVSPHGPDHINIISSSMRSINIFGGKYGLWELVGRHGSCSYHTIAEPAVMVSRKDGHPRGQPGVTEHVTMSAGNPFLIPTLVSLGDRTYWVGAGKVGEQVGHSPNFVNGFGPAFADESTQVLGAAAAPIAGTNRFFLVGGQLRNGEMSSAIYLCETTSAGLESTKVGDLPQGVRFAGAAVGEVEGERYLLVGGGLPSRNAEVADNHIYRYALGSDLALSTRSEVRSQAQKGFFNPHFQTLADGTVFINFGYRPHPNELHAASAHLYKGRGESLHMVPSHLNTSYRNSTTTITIPTKRSAPQGEALPAVLSTGKGGLWANQSVRLPAPPNHHHGISGQTADAIAQALLNLILGICGKPVGVETGGEPKEVHHHHYHHGNPDGVVINVDARKMTVNNELHVDASQNELHVDASQNELHIDASQNELHVDASQNELHIDASQNELHIDASQNELHVDASQNELHIDASQNELHVDASQNELHVDASQNELNLDASQHIDNSQTYIDNSDNRQVHHTEEHHTKNVDRSRHHTDNSQTTHNETKIKDSFNPSYKVETSVEGITITVGDHNSGDVSVGSPKSYFFNDKELEKLKAILGSEVFDDIKKRGGKEFTETMDRNVAGLLEAVNKKDNDLLDQLAKNGPEKDKAPQGPTDKTNNKKKA